MSAYVGYISALYYWREVSRGGQDCVKGAWKSALRNCCRRAADLSPVQFPSYLFGPGTTDLVVSADTCRTQPESYTYHVCTKSFAPKSFLEVAPGTYVASPELCFLQLAHMLSVQGLVQLGLELCGSYRLRPDGGFDSDCQPLTTPEKLISYLQKSKGHYKQEKSLKAAKWVLPCSASPRESALYERVCLPKALGGQHAPQPELNGFMRLNHDQRFLASRSKLYGDMYWPDQNVLLEYDGELAHTGRDRLEADARRDNAIASRHTRRLTVTASIYRNELEFDKVMVELFHMLGARRRKPTDEQRFLMRNLVWELQRQEALTWRQNRE